RIHRSQWRRIAGFVRPGLKVHCLGRADADQDAQDFDAAGPLRHRWIETVPTLFDGRKVESRGVGHRLNEVRVAQISIGPGNCRMLSNRQSWDGLRKDEVWIKVRVMVAAAVPSPPTGVKSKLRE